MQLSTFPLLAMQAASVPWRSSIRFGFPGEAAFSELRNWAWEDFPQIARFSHVEINFILMGMIMVK